MDKKLLDYFKQDELAANVWQSKYALPGEKTPDDMHKRMAKEFAKIESKYWFTEKYSDELSEYGKKLFEWNKTTQGEVEFYEDKIYNLFKDFKYIVPQGSIMSMLGNPKIGSLSNCFVIGQPYDSYGGIMQKEEQMVQLMKRRRFCALL